MVSKGMLERLVEEAVRRLSFVKEQLKASEAEQEEFFLEDLADIVITTAVDLQLGVMNEVGLDKEEK